MYGYTNLRALRVSYVKDMSLDWDRHRQELHDIHEPHVHHLAVSIGTNRVLALPGLIQVFRNLRTLEVSLYSHEPAFETLLSGVSPDEIPYLRKLTIKFIADKQAAFLNSIYMNGAVRYISGRGSSSLHRLGSLHVHTVGFVYHPLMLNELLESAINIQTPCRNWRGKT